MIGKPRQFSNENDFIDFLCAAMESAIKLIQVYEANYPEYLHRVFVINGT